MHPVQDRAKDRYDAGAVERDIKVGDFVRVFHPTPKRAVPFKFHLPWSDARDVGIQGVVLPVREQKSPKRQTWHFKRVSLTLPPGKRGRKIVRVSARRA